MINTVMFDLDGTLLPMDLEEFISKYFALLKHKVESKGYDGAHFMKALFKATEQVVANDGSQSNEDCFWNSFCDICDIDKAEINDLIIDFYQNEFHQISNGLQVSQNMIEITNILKQKGYRLVCATNPLFPSLASAARLAWSGVDNSAFEHISTYEDFHYCKPNPDYFNEVFTKWKINPDNCIMVGNDTQEDGVIEKLGVNCYIVTDHLINHDNKEIKTYWHGDSQALLALVKTFEDIKKV